jgi:murein DD-endopeptidase MepM/ murein hydrolase activator NlpD
MPVSPPLTAALIALALLCPSAASAQGDWQWPVRGEVITSYSNDNSKPYAGGMHRGVDIAAPVGAKVEAARAGAVSYAGNLGSSGLTVAVKTDDGTYATSYLHLSAIAVSRGEHVDGGQRLGAVGTTGERSAQQPHLHFGVRLADRDNFYIDPLTLLPPLPAAAAPTTPVPVSAPVPVRAAEQPVPAALRSRGTVRVPAPSPQRPRVAVRDAPQVVLHPVPATPSITLPATRDPRSAPAGGRGLSAAPRPERLRHPDVTASPTPSTSTAAGTPWGRLGLVTGLGLLALAALSVLVRGIANASHPGMLAPWRTTRRSRSGSPTRISRRSMPRLRAAALRTGRQR